MNSTGLLLLNIAMAIVAIGVMIFVNFGLGLALVVLFAIIALRMGRRPRST